MSAVLPCGPAYGRGTLAELMPAIASQLGVPGAHDAFGLPRARAYVLFLVDGLGWHLLRRHLGQLGYFPQLLADARPISAPVPSTTAVSLTTLGTGCPPGEHGIVGYTFRTARHARVLNALRWGPEDPIPESFQPLGTWFEILSAAGVAVSSVARAKFQDSGLTRAGLRGGRYLPVADHAGAQERITQVSEAVGGSGPAFVYLYDGDLDHIGHARGVGSSQWRGTLQRIDEDLEKLRDAMPADVCVLVTGDHGMVDVPAEHHILVEDEPRLASGVDRMAGEGRFRQLYTDAPAKLAARWSGVLGERAWVCTREQAAEAGWFGPELSARSGERLGDVLVAMRGDWAVMTKTKPHELTLIGQHGSLTEDEMLVPLLIDEGWAD
ncbi:alkaline phosphatase family protein [Propionibacterium sp.]|uniref:alkaline phosphatase family protein n=1 Tax=Propionibacterium sp. TaxID=1977903 RepID=UPI0039EC2C70